MQLFYSCNLTRENKSVFCSKEHYPVVLLYVSVWSCIGCLHASQCGCLICLCNETYDETLALEVVEKSFGV